MNGNNSDSAVDVPTEESEGDELEVSPHWTHANSESKEELLVNLECPGSESFIQASEETSMHREYLQNLIFEKRSVALTPRDSEHSSVAAADSNDLPPSDPSDGSVKRDVTLVGEEAVAKETEILSSFDDNGNPKNWQERESKQEDSSAVNPDPKTPTAASSTDQSTGVVIGQRCAPQPFQIPNPAKMQNSLEALGDEPHYFINAATLEGSGEGVERFAGLDQTSPLVRSRVGGDVKPLTQRQDGQNTFGSNEVLKLMRKSLSQQDKNGDVIHLPNVRSLAKRQTSTNDSLRGPVQLVKPKVPSSKSFPDIIQITFVDDNSKRAMLANDTLLKADHVSESRDLSANDLTADSLEDLPSKTVWDNHDLLATQAASAKGLNGPAVAGNDSAGAERFGLEDIMSQSVCQTGILSEKPPEAWVIDFNSLSMDAETFENQMETSGSGARNSNPNSLAFFVNMDKSPIDEDRSAKSIKSQSSDKKIFSMFVDIGDQRRDDDALLTSSGMSDTSIDSKVGRGVSPLPASAKPSRLPVHKNVMTVIRDNDGFSSMQSSRGSLGSHASMTSSTESDKTSATSALKHKKRTFQYPSPIMQHKAAAEAALKALPTNAVVPKAHKCKEPALDASGNPVENSIHSNRSSLHVATDLDIMAFSSSYVSSMEMSTIIADEPCSKGPCFKLGKDLLRMFQDGINTDVTICVNGRYLEAHKCILSSRSQYFAAMFSGQAGDVVTLDGFSYNVVHFTMCHIYSGTNEIPDTIDLLELATLTDLLGLEGLRENISQTIRVKYCHNFHRPCTGCIAGVLECFPIAISCEMDDLHRKMTKWISKHFVRIWPTKAFANLGEEFIEKSLRYSVNHLSNDNILDITLGCDQLLTTMPSVRWTEPIFKIVNQLSSACVQFIGHNFSQVVQSKRFLLFGKGQQWNISRIEGTFVEAMELLTPDEACLSHTALSVLLDLGTETIDEVEWSTMFVDFIRMLAKEIERYLTGNASKVVLSKYWENLGQDVRKRICTSSFLGYDKQGNKITKGAAAKAVAKAATPVDRPPSAESCKPNGKGNSATSHRPSNRSQTGGGKTSSPSPTSSRQPSGSSSGRGHVSTAKIASVKPIQNVLPSPQGKPPPVEPETRTQPATKTRTQPPSHAPTAASSSRRRAEVREKSFSNSPRNSVSSIASVGGSAMGTPINALTPVVPSKPGPGQPMFPDAASDKTATNVTPRYRKPTVSRNVVAETPRAPPKKSFVTNSERANSVSKPTTLRQSSTSSVSSRISSGGSNKDSSPHGVRTTVQPTATKTTRHVPERTPIAERPKYSRSSKSNVFASDDSAENNVKANVSSSGRNAATLRDRSNSKSSRQQASPSVNSKDSTAKKSSSRTHQAQRQYSSNAGPDSMSSSSSNVMSRSTIETDSGETKIRTLAEIGRSSTFSKDEPTILGKLDSLHTLNIDFS